VSLVILFGLSYFVMVEITPSPRTGIIANLVGFYSPLPRIWEFGIGIIAFAGSVLVTSQSRKWNFILSWIAVCGLVVSLCFINQSTKVPSPDLAPALLFLALLLFAGSFGLPSALRAVLSCRPLVWLGDRSYSLYLWHWPLAVFATSLLPQIPFSPGLGILVSFAPALLAFEFIEKKFRTTVVKIPQRRSKLGGLVLLPFFAAAVLFVGTSLGWGIANLETRFTTGAHAEQCIDRMRPFVEDCSFIHSSKRYAYLVGDSNAAMYAKPFAKASETQGLNFAIDTHSGCPYANVFVETFELPNKTSGLSCHELYTRTESALLEAPPGHVFIGTSSAYWGANLNQSVSSSSLEPSFTINDKRQAMEAGLLSAVKNLLARGHTVTLIQPIYTFSQPWSGIRIEGCSTLTLLLNLCKTELPESAAAPWDTDSKASFAKVLSLTNLGQVTFMNTRGSQCPETRCALETDKGVPVYSDANHLSLEFVPIFKTEFEWHLAQLQRDTKPAPFKHER
jgi:SGNH domain (fused to AT3 domains)/Acyltransferase family